jgi:tetratricopeptide (TPR) repeat protein
MPNAFAECFLDQADGYLKTQDFGGAARCVDEALAIEPENLRALSYGAAIIAASDGQKDMAMKLIQKALKLGPDTPMVISNAAHVFMRYGQPQRAGRLWERLDKLQPHSAGTLWNLAMYHYTQDDAEAAERYFRKVMELAPEKPSAAVLKKPLLCIAKARVSSHKTSVNPAIIFWRCIMIPLTALNRFMPNMQHGAAPWRRPFPAPTDTATTVRRTGACGSVMFPPIFTTMSSGIISCRFCVSTTIRSLRFIATPIGGKRMR